MKWVNYLTTFVCVIFLLQAKWLVNKKTHLYKKPDFSAKKVALLRKKHQLKMISVDYSPRLHKGKLGHFIFVENRKGKQGYLFSNYAASKTFNGKDSFKIELEDSAGKPIGEINRQGLRYMCDYENRHSYCRLGKVKNKNSKYIFYISRYYQDDQHSMLTKRIHNYRCTLSKSLSLKMATSAKKFFANIVCQAIKGRWQ